MQSSVFRLPRIHLTFWRAILLACIVGGIYGTVVRFGAGLGASTALSDSFPWGLWIGFDVLCGVALAAGGFTISAVVYIFHLERFRPVVRPAILTAFLGYMLVICALMFDLGKPWCIWHAMVLWNPHSVMFEVAWCVMLYTTVLALEFSPMLLERLRLKKPLRVVKSVMAPLVIIGVLLSMLHQSSLGSLYLIVPHKMHPLWYSPLLPVYFFVSAVCLGCCMTIFESFLSYRAFRKRLELNILSDLGKVTVVGLLVYLVLKLVDLGSRGSLGLILEPGYEGRMFLAEMLLGVVAPIVLFSMRRVREDQLGLFVAASLVVAGFLFNRLNVSLTAFEGAAGQAYTPALTEVFVTLMFVGLGFLLFALAVKYLPVFADHADEPQDAPALPLAKVLERPGWNFRTVVTASWAVILLVTMGISLTGVWNRNFAAGEPVLADPPAGRADDIKALPSIVFRFQKESPGPVTFKHSSHVKAEFPDCGACHSTYSKFFQKKPLPEDELTGTDFHDTAYCGACHDGEKSFSIGNETCNRCHAEKR